MNPVFHPDKIKLGISANAAIHGHPMVPPTSRRHFDHPWPDSEPDAGDLAVALKGKSEPKTALNVAAAKLKQPSAGEWPAILTLE
jgi:hypothetical protein